VYTKLHVFCEKNHFLELVYVDWKSRFSFP